MQGAIFASEGLGQSLAAIVASAMLRTCNSKR
jgi:hypothetical protein